MASSPLHAASTEHRIQDHDRPASRVQSGTGNGNGNVNGSGVIGSGSQLERTRRLQLRNAGFRGAAVPSRKVTPKAIPSVSTTCTSSATWSTTLGTQHSQSSDAENVSPSGGKSTSRSGSCRSKRQSSGILQEIGNSAGTIRQPKRARAWARVASGTFNSPDSTGKHDSAFSEGHDLSPQFPSAIPRSIRVARTKRTPMSLRRSISAETRRYVDHLELELQSAQAQLQAATSPSVTREQSSTMRHLKAETRRQAEDLAEWEARFDERLEEELRAAHEATANLQGRVRHLEQEAEVRAYRIHELEGQLESTRESRDSVEAANVYLEKRLEIMSELLAASPTKINLHAQVPGRPRPTRPQSMIQPRFPTASFLMSPERPPTTQPSSPSPSLIRFSPGVPLSTMNLSYSPDVPSSDEDSKLSDASVAMSNNSAGFRQTKKPTRRMRRFGAGSMGPKPLILPSTSYCEQIPMSAPLPDGDENPFQREWTSSYSPRSGSPSPHTLRRTSSEMDVLRIANSPFPDFHSVLDARLADDVVERRQEEESPPQDGKTSIGEECNDDDALLDGTLDLYSSGGSQATTRNFDSLGSAVGASIGRNLMEELTAVRTASSGFDQRASSCTDIPSEDIETVLHSSPLASGAEDAPHDSSPHSDTNMLPTMSSRFVSDSSTAVATASNPSGLPKLQSRASSKSLGVKSHTSISTLDSLRHFFGDMFDSPVALAKHLIETAQRRMWIPRPLLNIQWWLVGVLLGPMAKKRLLTKHPCCRAAEPEHSLLQDSISSDDSDMAYGEPYQTPSNSSPAYSSLRNRSIITGKGKKRTSSTSKGIAGRSKRCPHHANRYKHSPWLWLKFSMTLAIAVGVAFKEGPSMLLKDAFCQCKRTASGNWRRASRNAVQTP